MEENQEIVEEIIVDNDEIVGGVTENVTEQIPMELEQEETQTEFTDSSNIKNRDKENGKLFTQEEVNSLMSKRVERERRKYEKEFNPLINTLKAGGFDGSNATELADMIKESYQSQGIQLPSYTDGLTEREQQALAQIDAEEIIELGENAMQERFTELYNNPNKTAREEQEMYLIGKEHSTRLAKRELLELGAEPDKVLNDNKFKEFASKWASNVPVKEIYQAYRKINDTKIQQAVTSGSVKNNDNVGETFTQSKIDQMSPQELMKYWDNPEFRKIAGL